MTNYALIKDGIVDNVVLVDETTDGGQAYLAAIGEEYDDVVEVTGPVNIGEPLPDTGSGT